MITHNRNFAGAVDAARKAMPLGIRTIVAEQVTLAVLRYASGEHTEAATSDKTITFSFPPSNEALNAAYRERAQLVALLAAHYPSSIGATDPETPDWAVVTVELPTGQACWHIAPDDRDLFGHVQVATARSRPWDGHTTEEKYRRIRQQTAYIAAVTNEADGIEAVASRPERAK